MILNRTYHTTIQKSTNQLTYVPKVVANSIPLVASPLYPTCRPLHNYRKQGATASRNTSVSYTTPANCDPCINSRRVGKEFKMLGKNDNGEIKIPCCQPGPVGSIQGNIIDFSGRATIRTASTNVSPTYYSNYNMYLKSRGNTYATKSSIHKIPGVDYSKEINTKFYENNITVSPECQVSIYNPSNKGFSTQGGVDSSSYIYRLKYNAINKNNASFINPYGVKIPYQESPIFFAKNNFYKCTKKTCV
jgi:hypothetical protein